MAVPRALAVVTLFLSISAAAAVAIDFNYPAIFNFGDSNSDTGGLVAAMGEILDPPYGQSYFRRPAGRFCDGRLIIDFLMNAMDLPFSNPYLEAVGAPSFLKGCNFAAAGSTILPATAASVCPFSFGIQVAQFFHFKLRVTELLAKGNKFKKYIPPADFFSRGLYMFDIGQNDLAGAFYSKSEDQVIASIPTILLEFESGVKKLYDQGARNFWIHNTGPLGCLAQNVAQFGKDPSKLDEFGCVSSHNRAAKLFNLQLHALCTKLQAQFVDANVTYIDIFTIKSDLIANYSRYGGDVIVTNPTGAESHIHHPHVSGPHLLSVRCLRPREESNAVRGVPGRTRPPTELRDGFEYPITVCCGYGGPPLNYDSRIRCGQTKILDGNSVTAKGCSDATDYVNWDGIHYTDAANQFVSSQILTGKYSDPPFSDKMPFLLKLKF